jgi:hypothetical protein
MAKFSLIGNKADRILGMTAAAVAATTGAGLVDAPQAAADIVYSGPVNIVIPDNIDGIYMNLVTGATGTTSGVAGWDINPYSAAAGQFNLWAATTTTWYNPSGVIGNADGYILPFGTPISSGPNFFRPGGGTNVGAATNINLNGPNLFGVQFSEASVNGGANIYGWVEITFGGSASTRAITGYAYETSGGGIDAGAIPEPGSFAALALGALGLFGRRRRVA